SSGARSATRPPSCSSSPVRVTLGGRRVISESGREAVLSRVGAAEQHGIFPHDRLAAPEADRVLVALDRVPLALELGRTVPQAFLQEDGVAFDPEPRL